MKSSKLLSVLLIAISTSLVACNNTNSSSLKGVSSNPQSSRTYNPIPAIYYDALDVVKVDNGVDLLIKGSVEDFNETKVKFAFGLLTYQTSDSETGTFVYGKENPEDADYNYEVNIVNKSFEARLTLSNIKTLIGGEKYQIYAGPKGFYGLVEGASASENVLQDNEYKYYFRNDQEVGNTPKLVIDNLGPVRIEKVSIEKNVYERNGLFAKIGGANKENLTQEQFDAFDSFVNFQKLPNTGIRVRKEGSQSEGNPYYFYKVEGNEAFIYINIDFMIADNATSGKYNTHLNIKESKQENCVSTSQIDSEPIIVREDGAKISIYSHPGIHSEDNIWGNVGFIVEIPQAQ